MTTDDEDEMVRLLALDGEQPWMADALCSQVDPELFFPEKGGSTRPAKSVCANCPVAVPCLQMALDNDERFGVYGGLSEVERRRIKPRRPQPRHLRKRQTESTYSGDGICPDCGKAGIRNIGAHRARAHDYRKDGAA